MICKFLHLSVSLLVCPNVRMSICPSVRLFVCISVCLHFCLSIFLSVCISVRLYFCLSVSFARLITHQLSASQFMCLSVCLSFCPSIRLSIYTPGLSVCPSVRLSTRPLCVCLSTWLSGYFTCLYCCQPIHFICLSVYSSAVHLSVCLSIILLCV
jgi:hypothetical protein